MVKYQNPALDRTFAALSDPTRRAVLMQLEAAEHGLSVSELAAPFAMSLPAIMKHLDVLADAGLIARSKAGRTVTCRLVADPMEDAMNWLTRYQRFWTRQLDRLAAFVEDTSWLPPKSIPPSSPASRSNVVSMRRRKKSTRRGRKPSS